MIFSFGFLMTLGTFLPRYLKEFWWWFPLHIIIQVSAVILSLVGFGIALVSVSSQFASVHTYFGAVTLILAFVSPFIGTASHFMWKPSRDRIPVFPDVIHCLFSPFFYVIYSSSCERQFLNVLLLLLFI